MYRLRRRLGLCDWSLSAYVKTRVKNALQFIENFEAAVADEARRRGVDGVICGHIHKAEIRTIDGIVYMNDGDWVESCTALVEDHQGRFSILRWNETAARPAPVLVARAACPSRPSPERGTPPSRSAAPPSGTTETGCCYFAGAAIGVRASTAPCWALRSASGSGIRPRSSR